MEIEDLAEASKEVRRTEAWKTFWERLKEIKLDALLQLATVSPSDSAGIAHLQAAVQIIDALLVFPDELNAQVRDLMEEAKHG